VRRQRRVRQWLLHPATFQRPFSIRNSARRSQPHSSLITHNSAFSSHLGYDQTLLLPPADRSAGECQDCEGEMSSWRRLVDMASVPGDMALSGARREVLLLSSTKFAGFGPAIWPSSILPPPATNLLIMEGACSACI